MRKQDQKVVSILFAMKFEFHDPKVGSLFALTYVIKADERRFSNTAGNKLLVRIGTRYTVLLVDGLEVVFLPGQFLKSGRVYILLSLEPDRYQ